MSVVSPTSSRPPMNLSLSFSLSVLGAQSLASYIILHKLHNNNDTFDFKTVCVCAGQ